MKTLARILRWGVGGGGTPYDGQYGEASPERSIFFRPYVCERVGISLVFKYIKGKGNLSFGSVKGPKGLTDEFCRCIKSRKRFIFVIDSELKDSAFTEVKREAKF